MSVRWLAVALFLCASFLTLGSAGAQGTSTLTVHARYCDPGVIPDDPFLECHENPLDQWGVNIDGPEPVGETDAEGNYSLDGLDAGDYVLYVQAPLKATTYRVYCTEVGGDGSFLDLAESGNGMAIPVAAGVEVICDWYWLISDEPLGGEPSSLTIHARICPSDELPADIFATCHDTAGENIEFFVNDGSVGATNGEGNLFLDVTGDANLLSGGVPGEFARNFIYCSNNETLEQILGLTEVSFEVEVPTAAEGVTCDWYVIPEDLRGDTPTPAPTATATPDDDDDDEVTQLPNTGAGTTSTAFPLSLFAILAVALSALVGSTFVVGRAKR